MFKDLEKVYDARGSSNLEMYLKIKKRIKRFNLGRICGERVAFHEVKLYYSKCFFV